LSDNDFQASLFLTTLYHSYDFSSIYRYDDLQLFYTDHLRELGIDIENQETFVGEKLQVLDYFVFFLEKVFL